MVAGLERVGPAKEGWRVDAWGGYVKGEANVGSGDTQGRGGRGSEEVADAESRGAQERGRGAAGARVTSVANLRLQGEGEDGDVKGEGGGVKGDGAGGDGGNGGGGFWWLACATFTSCPGATPAMSIACFKWLCMAGR